MALILIAACAKAKQPSNLVTSDAAARSNTNLLPVRNLLSGLAINSNARFCHACSIGLH